MRTPIGLLSLLVVSASGCAPRANPLLVEMIQTRGVKEPQQIALLTLAYDDSFHPIEVVSRQGELEDSWKLRWQGNLLSGFTFDRRSDGVPVQLETSTIEYTGRNLDAIVTDAGDRFERTTSFQYESGRLSSLVVDEVSPAGTRKLVRTIRSDESDQLVEISDALSIDEEQAGSVSSTVSYEDEKPVLVRRQREEVILLPEIFVRSISAVYEEERLVSLVTEAEHPTEDGGALTEVRSELQLSYDDEGLLTSAVTSVADEDEAADPAENDVTIQLRYERGEAVDLDITPQRLFGFPLWDLRGQATSSLVDELQAARLVELGW